LFGGRRYLRKYAASAWISPDKCGSASRVSFSALLAFISINEVLCCCRLSSPANSRADFDSFASLKENSMLSSRDAFCFVP
jgi:hypothetical protein